MIKYIKEVCSRLWWAIKVFFEEFKPMYGYQEAVTETLEKIVKQRTVDSDRWKSRALEAEAQIELLRETIRGFKSKRIVTDHLPYPVKENELFKDIPLEEDFKKKQMKELGIDYHEDLGQRTRGDGGVYRKVYVDLYKKDGKDFYVEIDAVCVDIAPDPALFRLENLKHHINGFRTIDIKWSCDRCLKKNPQTYDGCNYCGHPRKWKNR